MKLPLLFALLISEATFLAAQSLPPLTPEQLKEGNYQTLQAYVQPTDTSIAEVNEKPMYPFGEQGMLRDLVSHITYPKNARKKGITGTVLIQFIIEKDGTMGEVTVKKSVDPELDAAAIKAVKQLQRFYPGKAAGSYIRLTYFLPVKFSLN